MDIEWIRPSSPAMAFSGFPQANPKAIHQLTHPAITTLPAASIDTCTFNYPNPNHSSNPHVFQSTSNQLSSQRHQPALDVGGATRKMRKRKAESQDNERLSKRLSLLNLEQNGQKLYVPVESPKLRPNESPSLTRIPEDDSMQLDNTKHKVYIYNLDDELSDSGESDDGNGRLVLLPDIEKHLMQNRIPPSVLANKDGEIAGMQMVLYSEPTSLTVPKEQDSVRKAIIEARQRVREKQKEEREHQTAPFSSPCAPSSMSDAIPAPSAFDMPNIPDVFNAFTNCNGTSTGYYNYDPDAMEVDP
ncbi:hypothetical protein GGR54DRAFT_246530 [Hypoxylon sp. NC1633]|nr:hypothetical protein GGR54DRAFT_246530 [Hypoxylon sp. NC1633]